MAQAYDPQAAWDHGNAGSSLCIVLTILGTFRRRLSHFARNKPCRPRTRELLDGVHMSSQANEAGVSILLGMIETRMK